jgi:hypothetical protein
MMITEQVLFLLKWANKVSQKMGKCVVIRNHKGESWLFAVSCFIFGIILMIQAHVLAHRLELHSFDIFCFVAPNCIREILCNEYV